MRRQLVIPGFDGLATGDGPEEVTCRWGPTSGDEEWHTPAAIIEAARFALGGIDLDPPAMRRRNERSARPVISLSRMTGYLNDGPGRYG